MSLEDLINQMPKETPGWRPEEGDSLIGTVLELSEGYGEYSPEPYPIIIIHDDNKNEDIAIHCFHHILRNAVNNKKPEPGDRIGVKYHGKQPQKNNPSLSVAMYSFAVEPGGGKLPNAIPNLSSNNPNNPTDNSQQKDNGPQDEDTPF